MVCSRSVNGAKSARGGPATWESGRISGYPRTPRLPGRPARTTSEALARHRDIQSGEPSSGGPVAWSPRLREAFAPYPAARLSPRWPSPPAGPFDRTGHGRRSWSRGAVLATVPNRWPRSEDPPVPTRPTRSAALRPRVDRGEWVWRNLERHPPIRRRFPSPYDLRKRGLGCPATPESPTAGSSGPPGGSRAGPPP